MKKTLRTVSLFVAIGLGLTLVQAQTDGPVNKLDPAMNKIAPGDAKVEKLAGGFGFLEGPVWVRSPGYLLFSDIPANAIYKWAPGGEVSVFLKPSGFTGSDASDVGMALNTGSKVEYLIGSNAVTVDRQGRIVFCAHGDRQVVRLEKNGKRTVLADRYEGKRLNSPNDLIYKSDGALYFTDPPAGLRQGDKDPRKESSFNGVYLLKDGKLQAMYKELPLPNGIALSPDEKYLYVNDSVKRIIMRFDVNPDDTVANGKIFIDMTADKAPGGPDGMKVDSAGNIYSTGPGGLWVISSDGKHIGTITAPESITNLAFGDADGKSLYLAARTGLYRIRLAVPGLRP